MISGVEFEITSVEPHAFKLGACGLCQDDIGFPYNICGPSDSGVRHERKCGPAWYDMGNPEAVKPVNV